ncbi:uncharacterized protein HMPREF1541_07131 [Cyphellophora europaea CBS 101466]|uniref:Xylanolytic transcriptional activator regulatory domain-containing protein n=1 Tax=Cyphellophora europaea (strain CBS 101466) TaxID=1220924 RepID=W2RP62_CYPE1|nr:uncharacterized protein HMPREF1541_07131 [Cyphellophora europaea CBS 101466]ETN37509.1 hypothetical protein HMPREF1541_07131 [Cyphellophora europaea CBS 101466]
MSALLAAISAFALKGLDHEEVSNTIGGNFSSGVLEPPSIYFRRLSIKYMEEAISELDDEPLSLHVLQAMILNTYCLLVQGVKGRAWRYLGTCIRAAYELNLHLIDADKHSQNDEPCLDASQWCIDEEWRRAWWAIWEMDVYASVVRRCPTGIDWSQNITFLPAEDEDWYRGRPTTSCVLEVNVNSRWMKLVATKSTSAKAWFLLMNSLMKDAQRISSPIGIDRDQIADHTKLRDSNAVRHRHHENQRLPQNQEHDAAARRLSTILNALYCAVSALPKNLKYRGGHLGFGGFDTQDSTFVPRRLADCTTYSIYLMTQLTKLMIQKYHVFRAIGTKWTLGHDQEALAGVRYDSVTTTGGLPTPAPEQRQFQHLSEYFEAADNVVSILRSCSDDQYKHVNPFLASTTWLAGAVQLLHRSYLADDDPDRDLITSNFELISQNYRQTLEFWNMSRIPLSNWKALDAGLADFKTNNQVRGRIHYDPPCIFTAGVRICHHPSTSRDLEYGRYSRTGARSSQVDSSFQDVTSSVAPIGSMAPHGHDPTTTNGPLQPSTVLPTPESADQGFNNDLMHSATSMDVLPGNTPNFMEEMPFSDDWDGLADFSTSLDDLFSGSYMP